MGSEKIKTISYIALIFLCGSLSGAVVTNLWTNWSASGSRARADSSSSFRPRPPEKVVERFQQRFNLSKEQADQLHQILDEAEQTYRQHELDGEKIRQQVHTRIRALLNDEQKTKFDEMTARMDQKRRQHDKSER